MSAWIAVDKNGREYIYNEMPVRFRQANAWCLGDYEDDAVAINVPSGTAQKLTGKPLTWDDNCVELK